VNILCDVHIARRVVAFLKDNDILSGDRTADEALATFADNHDMAIMSKDADFRDSHLLRNTPHKLIKINLGNISTKRLIDIIEDHLEELKLLFPEEQWMVEVGREQVLVLRKEPN
jgi:predicted nuclease of predicted toxin-antitoxin system